MSCTPSPSPVPTLVPTPSPSTAAAPTSDINAGPFQLADGSYYGTGDGFRGDVDVKVTLKNGSITAISIENYVDDEKYFSRAKIKIVERVISAQDVDVDVVSGATYSSDGILSAVADALGLAYDPVASGGHGH